MARYGKIDVRIWGDEKFRKLSKPAPNAQTLWLFLLAPPMRTAIPGLYSIGEFGLAEAIGWPIAAFRRRWKEIRRAGMARADWSSRLVWVPKAVLYDPPRNTNVAKGWGRIFSELPECPLRSDAKQFMEQFMKQIGEPFLDEFRNGLGNSLGNSLPVNPPPPPQPTAAAYRLPPQPTYTATKGRERERSRSVAIVPSSLEGESEGKPKAEPPPTPLEATPAALTTKTKAPPNWESKYAAAEFAGLPNKEKLAQRRTALKAQAAVLEAAEHKQASEPK